MCGVRSCVCVLALGQALETPAVLFGAWFQLWNHRFAGVLDTRKLPLSYCVFRGRQEAEGAWMVQGRDFAVVEARLWSYCPSWLRPLLRELPFVVTAFVWWTVLIMAFVWWNVIMALFGGTVLITALVWGTALGGYGVCLGNCSCYGLCLMNCSYYGPCLGNCLSWLRPLFGELFLLRSLLGQLPFVVTALIW